MIPTPDTQRMADLRSLVAKAKAAMLKDDCDQLSWRKAGIRESVPNPTHSVRLSFVKSRRHQTVFGFDVYERGDDIKWCQAIDDFIVSLSRSLYPNKRAWKRARKQNGLIKNSFSLEGGNGLNDKRPHAHVTLEKPADMSYEQFRVRILRAASKQPWIMNGKNAVHICFVYEAKGLIHYNTKEGYDRTHIGG